MESVSLEQLYVAMEVALQEGIVVPYFDSEGRIIGKIIKTRLAGALEATVELKDGTIIKTTIRQ